MSRRPRHRACDERVFEYEPLDQDIDAIRVIELFPGRLHHHLECRLIHTTISSGIRFEALSYTWGGERFPRCLHIGRRCRPVTENAFAALLHLRWSKRSRFLWIDAVCIDQTNDDEKQHQVQFMHAIFQAAREVTVWLGIRPPIDNHRRSSRDPISNHQAAAGDMDDYRSLIVTDTLRKSIDSQEFWRELFHAAWFQRAWVLQEMVFARRLTVRYGGTELAWPELFQVAIDIQAFADPLRSSATCLQSSKTVIYMDRWHANNTDVIMQDLRIEDIVHSARAAQCRDPRDKIYSLLSLDLCDDGELLIVPDYTMPLARVQLELAKASIQRYESLNILKFVDHTSDVLHPSWVPRWDSQQAEPLPSYPEPDYFTGDSEICRMRRRIIDSGNQVIDLLCLRGTFLMVIECVVSAPHCHSFRRRLSTESLRTSSPHRDGDEEYQRINNGEAHLSLEDQTRITHFLIDSHEGRFVRSERQGSWVRGASYRTLVRPDPVSGDSFVEARSLEKVRFPCLRRQSELIARRPAFHSPLATPEELVSNRRVAVTRDGSYALVPDATETEDIVVAFWGIRALFVVRPYYSKLFDEDWFELVGACDIDGEINWHRFEQDENLLEDIVLC